MKKSPRFFLLALTALAIAAPGCTRKKQVWIYTSIYKEVIAEMEPMIKAAVPEADVQWYQGGSENVAAKVNAELSAGRRQGRHPDHERSFLVPRAQAGRKASAATTAPPPRTSRPNSTDPDHASSPSRIPVMVMAYNSEAYEIRRSCRSAGRSSRIPNARASSRWAARSNRARTSRLVAILSKTYGWEFFQKLRANEIVAAGGNSSVITRIETKERPIGIVLLENVLKARSKGSPVRADLPARRRDSDSEPDRDDQKRRQGRDDRSRPQKSLRLVLHA